MTVEVGQFAPKFSLFVNGTEVPEEVTRFITSVEFESSDGVVDMLSLNVVNPRKISYGTARDNTVQPFLWSDNKLFYPGNIVQLYMGYKRPLQFMTKMRLVEPEYDFPEGGTPSFSIKAYSPGYVMAANAPAAKRHREGEKLAKGKKKQESQGRLLSRDIAKVVTDKAKAYLFTPDVDPVKMQLPAAAFQRVGMSDHDLIKGLANMTGYIFWVDYLQSWPGEPTEHPVLHFRDPARLKFNEGFGLQDKKYTFNYADGDKSALLSFSPRYTIAGQQDKLVAAVYMLDGRVVEQEISVNIYPNNLLDLEFEGVINEDILPKALEEVSQVKISFNDFSIDVVPIGQSFSDPASLLLFMENWFLRVREQFITGDIATIGIENMAARQVHTIKGVGTALDGDYYFPRVRHMMSDTGGYRCDCSVRKIAGTPPLTKTHLIIPEPTTQRQEPI